MQIPASVFQTWDVAEFFDNNGRVCLGMLSNLDGRLFVACIGTNVTRLDVVET